MNDEFVPQMSTGGAGFLVVLEGPDGVGKSTQVKAVAEKFHSLVPDWKKQIITTFEPSDGPYGRRVRQKLTDGSYKENLQECFDLFQLDREMHQTDVISPALRDGHLVLCDRHVPSTLVYQGKMLNRSMAELLPVVEEISIRPDLTIFLTRDTDDVLATGDMAIERDMDERMLIHRYKKAQALLEEENYACVEIDTGMGIEETTQRIIDEIIVWCLI